uniref:Uncharacterized protein n=1 Tax=Hemiselmis andersenii TaxID=464988 RepID=A0A7S1DYP7_HEMAN|mmetsp:Transcript_3094/g.7472  ORF Transcript_3094/g.7472 Transcript_3094/m.7472 type:complete len:484 (+) Transcript_3094:115-1566(+)
MPACPRANATSTAFADASSSANSRMADSFTSKAQPPSESATAKAMDECTMSRIANKQAGKNSQFFAIGGKLDASRGAIEGTESKKLVKARTKEESSGDAALLKAASDSSAVMRSARSKNDKQETSSLIYDKSQPMSSVTTSLSKQETDSRSSAVATGESMTGRETYKDRSVSSAVFTTAVNDRNTPRTTGRAHNIKQEGPVRMQSARTTTSDRAADAATKAQAEEAKQTQRALYKKNHDSNVFSSDGPRPPSRADNRKNNGVAGGIFADSPVKHKNVIKLGGDGKHADNDIFTDKPAPEYKAVRSAVVDANANTNVFAGPSDPPPPTKACRAAVHDRNAGADVFSNTPEVRKSAKGGINAKALSGSGVFSDGKVPHRPTVSSHGTKNKGTLDVFKGDAGSAGQPLKRESNPKNLGSGIFAGGAFAQDATKPDASKSRPDRFIKSDTSSSRPSTSAGRPATAGGGDMSVQQRKNAMLQGSGSLW